MNIIFLMNPYCVRECLCGIQTCNRFRNILIGLFLRDTLAFDLLCGGGSRGTYMAFNQAFVSRLDARRYF